MAQAWGKLEEDGRVILLGDSRHRWVNPVIYKRDDAEVIWGGIKAPMLLLLGSESDYRRRLGPDGTEEALRAAFPAVEIGHVAGAGHMLHIEKAERVAALIEQFLMPGLSADGPRDS